jgi:hypothetical protein
MTDKPEPKDAKKNAKEPRPIIHLGTMGDGTKEQNLGEPGDPAKRIEEDEVDAAFSHLVQRNPPRRRADRSHRNFNQPDGENRQDRGV